MRGAFDDYRDLNQPTQRQDTELTLSATMLLMLFFGLVLLCGVCFGLGYATGHRGTQEASVLAPSVSADLAVTSSGHSKPGAEVQSSAPAEPPSDPADKDPSEATDPTPQNTSAAGAPASSLATQIVKPALGAGVNPIQAAQPATSPVGPALAGAGNLMVQIASISEQEDADVLVGALRRRGYAVVEHREPIDGLIHVRVGPFKTLQEAETWRQRLLNDGYNAIVQP
jgi:DedD protein